MESFRLLVYAYDDPNIYLANKKFKNLKNKKNEERMKMRRNENQI